MAITVTERPDSRPASVGEGKEVEMRFNVRGTADEEQAILALKDATDATYQDLQRNRVGVRPVFVDVNSPGDCLWLGTVVYTTGPATGQSTYSFDFSGEREHVEHSIKTRHRYKLIHPDGSQTNPPNVQGIGDQGDRVEGVDIYVPRYDWTETHYLPEAYVTQAYKTSLFRTCGKINGDPFRGFERGEVLLMGATGQWRPEHEDYRMAFSFSARENRNDLGITDTDGTKYGDVVKGGWDYVWFRYTTNEDADSGELRQWVTGVYVEQVYRYADFSVLGIGA